MSVPIVLIPGLNCSARIYGEQLAPLWQHGSVMVADHTRGDSMETIARHILAAAPPQFALVGYSMGGYIAFELLRQAPTRIVRLALLDTGARPDSPGHIKLRMERIAMTRAGRFDEVLEQHFPALVHPSRHNDEALHGLYRRIADECGAETFIRHQTAIINRPDSRPMLAAIGCPTLVLVGDSDKVTPPPWAEEMAAGIAGARLVVVPTCGHLSTLEQPQAVNDALVRWIGKD